MKQLRYLWLELNSAIKGIVVAVAGILSVMILLVCMLLGAYRIQNHNIEASKLNVGIVLPKDNELAALIPLANSFESIRQICTLKTCTFEEAQAGLKGGDYEVIVNIPGDFIDKAIHMQQAEFELYTLDDTTKYEQMLIDIIIGIEKVMVITEGSINSMYSVMNAQAFDFSVPEMEDGLTRLYVRQCMARDEYFNTMSLSQYGTFSFVQYYIASIIIIIVTLSVVVFYYMDSKEEKFLVSILFGRKSEKCLAYMIKVMAKGIAAFILMCVMYVLASVISKRLGYDCMNISLTGIGVCFTISLSVAILMQVFLTAIDNEVNASIIYVFVNMLQVTVCGGIAPTVYLPSVVGIVGKYLPFAAWHELLLVKVCQPVLFEYGLNTATHAWVTIVIWDVLLLSVGMVLGINNSNYQKAGMS